MTESNSDFEIRVEFQRGTGDPARVFRAMTGLIESAQNLDEHLAGTIGTTVHTSLILQDIETASLKAKLQTIIQSVPDEALRDGDTKKVIGHFLLKAKHRVLDWCSARSEIQGRDEVEELEGEILRLAEQADVKLLPAYAPVDTGRLLSDVTAIHCALANLERDDRATFSSLEGISKYNPNLVVSDGIVRELVTRETITTEGVRIVKVKKPDYLGSSKWGFRYMGHQIEAKILDGVWLAKFQDRRVALHPGDSLRVVLRECTSYGYDNELVHVDYEVVEVQEVIPAPKFQQTNLIDGHSDN